MSTRFKEDSYVKCPYYCKDDSIHIKCKGICGSHSIQEFLGGKAEKESFEDDFCRDMYWNCSQYRACELDEV